MPPIPFLFSPASEGRPKWPLQCPHITPEWAPTAQQRRSHYFKGGGDASTMGAECWAEAQKRIKNPKGIHPFIVRRTGAAKEEAAFAYNTATKWTDEALKKRGPSVVEERSIPTYHHGVYLTARCRRLSFRGRKHSIPLSTTAIPYESANNRKKGPPPPPPSLKAKRRRWRKR